jgi:hypothetical protein
MTIMAWALIGVRSYSPAVEGYRLAKRPTCDNLAFSEAALHQTCSSRCGACGASRLAVDGRLLPLLCQAFNGRPYADATAFPERAIALPEDSPVTFRRYRAPPPRSTAGYALLAAGLLWSSWGSVH